MTRFLQFLGELLAPTDGVYTFFLLSYDGTRLTMDGGVVVENEGSGLRSSSSTVYLTAGWHSFV